MSRKAKGRTFREAFENAEPRPSEQASRSDKKNYAERLSRQLAQVVADGLRKKFPGILPTPEGNRQESKARTSKGFKKLDVNYSTIELGLALGVSIKTINFSDRKTGRFTKNYSRNENELRAEATDYHKRQPWAVLVAVIFLPLRSCDDSKSGNRTEKGTSSFGAAVRFFRTISGRERTDAPADQFERVVIGLYDEAHDVRFFDVDEAPPKSRRPHADETLDFERLIHLITETYDARNSPPFVWADDDRVETGPLELADDPED
jgi:hypothetical protein